MSPEAPPTPTTDAKPAPAKAAPAPARPAAPTDAPAPAPAKAAARAPAPDDAADALFWRSKYEQERERLAKLWAAYQDKEAELAALRARHERSVVVKEGSKPMPAASSPANAPEAPKDS